MNILISALCCSILLTAVPGTLLANDFKSAIGFGVSVTGGTGAPICYVTNLDDSGQGSLRGCVNSSGDNPTQIVFNIEGTIRTKKYIYLTSNLTIDASGKDITISGADGFACFNKENIIIRNIKIVNIDHGVRMRDECKRVWLDHLYLTNITDESISIDQGSTNITVSWTHIENTDKAVLIGSSHEDDRTKKTKVTLHHNYFGADQRNPNVRYATVHAYNNLIQGYLYEGIIASQEARVIAESNVISPSIKSNRKRFGILAADHNVGDYTHGFIWSTGNLFLDDAGSRGAGLYQRDSKPTSFYKRTVDRLFHPWFFRTAPDAFDIPYDYKLQPANSELVDTILTHAGATL